MYLLHLLAIAGLTGIITKSHILLPVRNWVAARSKMLGKLIRCPQCMGFWVGLSYGFIFVPPPFHWLHYAFAGSLVSWLLVLLAVLIERKAIPPAPKQKTTKTK